MRRTTAVLLIAFLLPTTASAAPAAAESPAAAEARETFRSLFGRDVARARGTPASEDDVALAKRLLAVARDATASPAFLAILCDEAYALAAPHEGGKATAAGAMHLLAEHVPDRAEAARERLASLRGDEAEPSGEEAKPAAESKEVAEPAEPAARPMSPKDELDALLAQIEEKKEAGALVEAAGLYRKAKPLARRIGDDRLGAIEAGAEVLGRRIGLQRRARDVRAMLERDPDNVSAREGLVRLYLVNLNDPKRAAEVLKGVEDADLKKYVPAAAKPVDAAPELACLQLGEWYAGLAERAPDYAKATMFGRAKTYLDRFLSLHETKDMAQVRAKVAMEKVEEALRTLAPAATQKPASEKPAEPAAGIKDGVIKPGTWVDLLPLVDPEKDAVRGPWQSKPGSLVLAGAAPYARVRLPVRPEGGYDFQARFVRRQGNADVNVMLPVGETAVALRLDSAQDHASGLETIDGRWAPGNETATKVTLENGRTHALAVGVRPQGDNVHITATLDGQSIVDWTGPQADLALRDKWTLGRDGVPGLGAYLSTVTFEHVRLRMLTGEARLLRPEDAGAGAGETAGAEAVAPPASAVIKPDGWVDLMSLIDLGRDARSEGWERDGSTLAVRGAHAGHRRLFLPVAPNGDYVYALTFLTKQGLPQVWQGLALPGGRATNVVAQCRGPVLGLHRVEGKHWTGNSAHTPLPEKIAPGRECMLVTRVTQTTPGVVRVTTTLNGQRPLVWEGPLDAVGEGADESRPLSMAVHASQTVFTGVRLKMLTGEARLLRPEDAGGGAASGPGTAAADRPAATGPVVDALGTIDPDRDALTGGWRRDGEALVIHETASEAKAMAPLAVEGSYRMEAEFVRTRGNDTVGIALPVGDRQTLLALAYNNQRAHSLDQIRSVRGDENETAVRPARLENGRAYTVGAQVTVDGDQARIGVWLEGKQIIDWTGPTKDLTMYPGWRLPQAHRLGVGASNSEVRWRRLLIQPTGGRIRPLRPLKAKPATVPEGKAPDFFDLPAE